MHPRYQSQYIMVVFTAYLGYQLQFSDRTPRWVFLTDRIAIAVLPLSLTSPFRPTG